MKKCKCFTRDRKGHSFESEIKLTRYIDKWLNNLGTNVKIISLQIVPVAEYPGQTSNFMAFIIYEGIKK